MYLQAHRVLPTNDSIKFNQHSASERLQAKIVALWDGGSFVSKVTNGQFSLILDRTSFFSETLSQIHDSGSLNTRDATATILRVQKCGEYVVHVVEIKGSMHLSEIVILNVDYAKRALIAKNHSVMHALLWAVRQTVPESVVR